MESGRKEEWEKRKREVFRVSLAVFVKQVLGGIAIAMLVLIMSLFNLSGDKGLMHFLAGLMVCISGAVGLINAIRSYLQLRQRILGGP